MGKTDDTSKKTESDYKSPTNAAINIINELGRKPDGKQTHNMKTYYNNDYKFKKSKKNTYILGQARKSSNFRIKHHGSKGRKSKHGYAHNENTDKQNEYSFGIEDEECAKSDISSVSNPSTKYNKSYITATPYKKSKLKIKLINENSETLINSDSKAILKPKKVVKKYNLEEFTVLALLGYGTFGSVLLVKHPESLNPFALKVVK